jgi:hypothetical protein
MGRVVDKCCCPSPVAFTPTAIDASCGAKVQARDCCERLERASGDVAPVLREKAGLAGFLPALAEPSPIVVRGSEPLGRDVIPEPVEARAPRPRGPPIFLANCSFLT